VDLGEEVSPSSHELEDVPGRLVPAVDLWVDLLAENHFSRLPFSPDPFYHRFRVPVHHLVFFDPCLFRGDLKCNE
jgi:hypothetical protein